MHGKAAIDVLGARMGKSGGALLQQLLVLACGDILSAAPVTAGLFYAVREEAPARAPSLRGITAEPPPSHASPRSLPPPLPPSVKVMAAWIAAAVRLGGLFATASAEHAAARAKAE